MQSKSQLIPFQYKTQSNLNDPHQLARQEHKKQFGNHLSAVLPAWHLLVSCWELKKVQQQTLQPGKVAGCTQELPFLPFHKYQYLV